jgi:methylmalonyl-CoA/ethylmalonyl-CoA epimerase
MNRKIHVIAIAFALCVVIGDLSMNAAPATAQDEGVGFEISPHHVGISVPNLEESIAWYQKMLGFKVVQRMTQGANSGMIVALLQRGNCYIELFQVAGAKPLPEYRRDPTADLHVHGIKHMAFQVSDVLAATKELKAKGAEIAMGPVDSPGVVFVFIRDNSGNTFELIQFKKQ